MKLARIADQTGKTVLAAQTEDGTLVRCEGRTLYETGSIRLTDEPVCAAQYLPPVDPCALICIGVNYRKHITESSLEPAADPVVFMKNPAAVTGHRQPIVIPSVCGDEVDYEAELAVVLGKPCMNASRKQAGAAIAGFMAANDISARLWQFERGGGQWTRGKSFDTFAPTGPFLVTPDEVGDIGALTIRTLLDGEIVQESGTGEMRHDVPDLISFLSQGTTLHAGTVILTGTPEGVGWFRTPRRLLRPGSTVQVEIERVGVLINPVVAAEDAKNVI